MDKVIEHLPHKHGALNSNPILPKTENSEESRGRKIYITR
jgi:hypothetical protein